MGYIVCCVSACHDELISPTQSETIQGHVPNTAPPPPLSPEKPTASQETPAENTTPPVKENPPAQETYSERTINAGHHSTNFKVTETTPPVPLHELINQALEKGLSNLTMEELKKVIKVLIIEAQNDPAGKPVIQKMAEDPNNTPTQQQVADFLKTATPEQVDAAIDRFFQKFEYYKTLFENIGTRLKNVTQQAQYYGEVAKNYTAVLGGGFGAVALSSIAFQACRAEGAAPLGGHRLPWLSVFLVESYYALKLAHTYNAVQSTEEYLGFGFLMGVAAVLQCEGIKAFKKNGVARRFVAFCSRRIKGTASGS